MQFVKYIGLLFNRAAQKSVLLTDRLTILIVPFATLVVWLAGAKMTDSVQETLLLGVAMTVMAVVILRLIAASYFVWKEDQSKIARLDDRLNSPRFREVEVMNDHRLQLRKELGDRIAWLITFAEYRAKVEDVKVMYEDAERLYVTNFARAREIISQLSYDVPLRVVCLNTVKLAAEISQRGIQDFDGERSPMLDRLWKQRKLTFRLLHRQDIDEIITLAEVENLIEEFGESFGETSGLDEIKTMLREDPGRFERALSLRAITSGTR